MSVYARACPRVWRRLLDTYGEAAAEHWLTHPHELLAGASPFDVVCSCGEDEVLALLDQIETGAFG